MNLERLNSWPVDEAVRNLHHCCASTRWATRLSAERPFHDPEQLFAASERIWRGLTEGDWLEAFSAHPRIGQKKMGGPAEMQRWSSEEQAGMRNATDALAAELGRLNDAYFEKFGFVFLICATGKAPEEMLEQIKERIGNDRATEICNAMTEQGKITKIRLEKLL